MKALSKSPAITQAGQMTIEMMLLMTVFLMIALAVQKRALSNTWMQTLIEGPWSHVEGIIEAGVWYPAGAKANALHPSLLSRKGTVEGDKAP